MAQQLVSAPSNRSDSMITHAKDPTGSRMGERSKSGSARAARSIVNERRAATLTLGETPEVYSLSNDSV
jgi:hypothetical protein